MKRLKTILAVLLLSVLTLLECSRGSEPTTPGKKGADRKDRKVHMTAIKFDQLLGNRIPEHKGKIVVLDIWGTWCPSCKQEFPGLVRLHEKYGTKGVQCMSLCVPLDDGDVKDRPRALAFLEENKAVFTNYWLQDGWEPIQKKLDFEGLPVVIVFGKDGRIAKTFKADDEPRFTYEDVDKLTGDLFNGKAIVEAKATPKKQELE